MLGFDHFSFVAPIYDRVINFQSAERLARLARLPTKGTLLDAGGGTGRVAQALVGKAAHIVVADLSLGMLEQAAQKVGLKPVNSHTEAMPFPADSFDRVIMVDALHHVCNHRETADELWRVLKPGGYIVIEEPDIRTMVVKGLAIAEKLAFMRSHFISPPKIAGLFSHPDAQVYIEREGYNAWIVIEKQASFNLPLLLPSDRQL